MFEAKFVEITYKNKRDIRYIFSTLDTYLKSKHKEGISDIYNPGEALSPSLDNIEHWALKISQIRMTNTIVFGNLFLMR